MKKRRLYLFGSNVVVFLLLIFGSFTATAQVIADFSRSDGFGVTLYENEAPIILKDRLQINNIHVEVLVADPFDPNRIVVVPIDYPALHFKFCQDEVNTYLVPVLDGEPACGSHHNIRVDLSESQAFGLSMDRVQVNHIRLDRDVPDPFDATIVTTVTTYHDLVFRFDSESLRLVSLFRSATPPHHVRVEVTWGDEPRDLDVHLTGPAPGMPATYNNEADRFHIYFGNRMTDVASLAEASPFSDSKPEALTIYPQLGANTLRPGIYQLSVHHFAGGGSLDTSQAVVRVWLDDAWEPVQIFIPPPDHLSQLAERSTDVWVVFDLHVAEDGIVTIAPLQSYRSGINPYSIGIF
jgi:hypothetical protein